MSKPVINADEAQGFPLAPETPSEKFGATIAPIGPQIGLKDLGCMVTVVEPGKRAFPFHNHLGAEEMFVILEGEGTYRFGDSEHKVKAGDICGAPKGGPDTAHQIINTGTGTLTYLGISTQIDPDVVEFPDSGKFAAIAVAPGPDFFQSHLRVVARREDSRDYWEGEAE
ncbi:MAG: cupin domain-containing protein [Pseudomonadota bacterium]